jgi:hypothetical protein
MSGGAYSLDVNQQIAGNPVVLSYPDKYAPAIINGNMATTAPGASCGMTGGKRNSKRNNKKRSGAAASSRKRKHTAIRRTNRRRRNHRGGSMPAPYDAAYKGEMSNFSDDMKTRDFGCSQPAWKPTCI